MRDIIQLCPISSASLSWVMWITMYTVQKLDIVSIYNEINGLFDYFEKIFAENFFMQRLLAQRINGHSCNLRCHKIWCSKYVFS